VLKAICKIIFAIQGEEVRFAITLGPSREKASPVLSVKFMTICAGTRERRKTRKPLLTDFLPNLSES
jgi:hypothetical protein